MNKGNVAVLVIAGGVLLAVLFLLFGQHRASPEEGFLPRVEVGSVTVEVSIADDDSERGQGLSGVSLLPEFSGKLFVFDEPSTPAFWMKDMLFAIDILWIDEGGTIVDITKSFTPESYPTSVAPALPVRFVLEVNAGFADRHGVVIGQSVNIKK
jgi:hypothetical protein